MTKKQTHTSTSKTKRWLRRMVVAALGWAVSGTLLSMIPRVSWFFELFTHFRVQYLVLGCLGLAWCTIRKRWRWALLMTATSLAQLPALWPFWSQHPASFPFQGGRAKQPTSFQTPPKKANSLTRSLQHPTSLFVTSAPQKVPIQSRALPTLRVVSANVMWRNRSAQRFVRWIKALRPDIVLALEAHKRWATQLAPLRKRFPYCVDWTRTDGKGLLLLSRFPLAWSRLVPASSTQHNHLIWAAWKQPWPLTLVGFHTVPPVVRRLARRRDRLLLRVARHIAQTTGPVVALGDLNITPWSPVFADFLQQARLHDARKGRGILGTWPGGWWPLALPIDHILPGKGAHVIKMGVGPAIGSDHRPIWADLAFGP